MEKSVKIPKTYQCEECNLITCSFKDYTKHTRTSKHKKRISMIGLNDSVLINPEKFMCSACNKCYKARNGLWYHQQKCKPTCQPIIAHTDASHNFVIDKELVMFILKQNADIIKDNAGIMKENSELKNMMMNAQNQMLEVIKTGTHNTNTINNTNSHNKTFNLQFFLNETCKNAMNIMDFVDSLKLQLCDLERMGEIGFVNGMSNIIIKNLQSMDITERPVHCTDQKREVMYVKDDGKWDKEEETKPKIRKAIKHIAHKNAKLIGEFKTKYPDYKTCASKISTQYNTMVIEAMGGIGCVDLINENKIIKRISKEILVDKECT
jgi:hypothetical protein